MIAAFQFGEPLTQYAAILVGSLLINAADIYFLQTERLPQLHRSVSFWFYLALQSVFAIFAGWLLYAKAGMHDSDWPLVTAIAVLSGFSVVQSLTLKIGEFAVVDARQLFDSWKRRVVEDATKANASRKRLRQTTVAGSLAQARSRDDLESAIRMLSRSMGVDEKDVIGRIDASGIDPAQEMARWIASTDLEYAEMLVTDQTPSGTIRPPSGQRPGDSRGGPGE